MEKSAAARSAEEGNGRREGNILEVVNLKTYFFVEEGDVKAVDGVSFHLRHGETLCIVGESGSGKSVTSLSIMRLVGKPGQILDGEIWFDGENLLELPEGEMVRIRGNRISMIFQQPQSSLNPVFKIGDQIAEVLDIHRSLGREEGRQRAISLLSLVGIPEAARRAEQYPHEMSGGMAQRVMIAMALACLPELLIADEPTTALDVTIQAQILDLMRELREKMEVAIILITHDMGVVAEMADRVMVMYAGRVQEQAPVRKLFDDPFHPYTVGLLGSIPRLGEVVEELAVIPGSPSQPLNLPPGCRFAPRCRARVVNELSICTEEEPDLLQITEDRAVRCWLYHPDYRPDGEIDLGYNIPIEELT
ncbi:MAG: ABC transporter ATP-binding protein [Chloroflexi bacterium]|nr:ABC transporter ATP-binding protein [Chloroflexota bacterium]